MHVEDDIEVQVPVNNGRRHRERRKRNVDAAKVWREDDEESEKLMLGSFTAMSTSCLSGKASGIEENAPRLYPSPVEARLLPLKTSRTGRD